MSQKFVFTPLLAAAKLRLFFYEGTFRGKSMIKGPFSNFAKIIDKISPKTPTINSINAKLCSSSDSAGRTKCAVTRNR